MSQKNLPAFVIAALALLASAPLAVAADSDKPAKKSASTDAAAPAGAKDKKSGDAATPGKKGGQAETDAKVNEATSGLGQMGQVLPLGQRNLDVKMPSFHDGKPSSFVRAGVMTRVDENHLDLEKVDIRIYGATQADDMRVQLITGTYAMDNQVLDSHERSRISRADFQLEGDAMIFDTHSQQGKMTGNVHMIIFDADSVKKRSAAPPASNAPSTPAEDNPVKDQK